MKWWSFITGSNMQRPRIGGLFRLTLHCAETMNRWSFIIRYTVLKCQICNTDHESVVFWHKFQCAETMNRGPYTLCVVLHHVTLCRDHKLVVCHHMFHCTETMNLVVFHHKFHQSETMNWWSFIIGFPIQRPWIGGLSSQVPLDRDHELVVFCHRFPIQRPWTGGLLSRVPQYRSWISPSWHAWRCDLTERYFQLHTLMYVNHRPKQNMWTRV